MQYEIVPFDVIQNPACQFYKLRIDGRSQFDEFVEKVESIAADKKAFDNLLAWMEAFNPKTVYPKEKFNSIKGIERSDVREFKKKNLRIYVITQYPDIYIVRGGYKKDQPKDVKALNNELKDFPTL